MQQALFQIGKKFVQGGIKEAGKEERSDIVVKVAGL